MSPSDARECSNYTTHLLIQANSCTGGSNWHRQVLRGMLCMCAWWLASLDPTTACDLVTCRVAPQAERERETRLQAFCIAQCLKNTIVPHCRPTSQDRRRSYRAKRILFWCVFKVIEMLSHRERKIFSHSMIWGCAIQIASHIAVASRD